MKYFGYALYSLSLALVWWLLLVDAKQPGSIGVLIGLLYSYYSPYFLRSLGIVADRIMIVLKYSCPLVYLIVWLITSDSALSMLSNPILFAVGVLISGHFLQSLSKQIAFQFFMLIGMYVYAFSVYNHWVVWERLSLNRGEVYDFRESTTSEEGKDPELFAFSFKDTAILGSLEFQSAYNSTFIIPTNNKPVILETWNERCVPCLRAIRDLQPFFYENAERFTHYYVYEPDSKFDYSVGKVFQFEEFVDEPNTLIDVDNEMYDELNISGYPYFLLFDSGGKLLHIQFGYSEKMKASFQQKVLSLIAE